MKAGTIGSPNGIEHGKSLAGFVDPVVGFQITGRITEQRGH